MKRKTKIIATIGPASLKYDIFKEVIKAGADFIRINTAYSNKKQLKCQISKFLTSLAYV